jgi:hypothetical protein
MKSNTTSDPVRGRQIVMDMMAEAQALIAQGRGSGID